MSSIESRELTISRDDEQTLLKLSVASVEYGLDIGRHLHVDASLHSPALQTVRASFVTLRIQGELRGCMGAIKAVEPLVADVARNAFAAAFRDPRFPKVTREEIARLEFHISVLSEPVAIEFDSEVDLLAKIRPGIDGLTLREGSRKGTLLPAVWEHISSPREFLSHLKKKADLPADYWSSTLRVERYTAQSIGHD